MKKRNPIYTAGSLLLAGALTLSIFLHLGMLGTVLEFWLPGILCKGQIHEVDPAIGDV